MSGYVHRRGVLCRLIWASSSRSRSDPRGEGPRRQGEGRGGGFWIYNDLPKGFAEAKKTGKPLLVVLRCIPCEECVKLDDDLVDQDERLRPLLEKFVRVRVVSTNGLDLSLFQFDTDQSFAVFLLNADGTIYGRFGTRSHRTHWTDDVSIEGLAKALEGALDLHAGLSRRTRPSWPPRRGPRAGVRRAGEATRRSRASTASQLELRRQRRAELHPLPPDRRRPAAACYRDEASRSPSRCCSPIRIPRRIGLILDPKERATVLRVEPGSLAEKAGFRGGRRDSTSSPASRCCRSPTCSGCCTTCRPTAARCRRSCSAAASRVEADAHPAQGLAAAGRHRLAGLELGTAADGPGRHVPEADVSPSSGPKRKLPAERAWPSVEHVGQYAPHDRAKKAGFRKGDILISFDGRTDLARETDLLAYALNDKQARRAACPSRCSATGRKSS